VQPLILATRASTLALTQANLVKVLLEDFHPGLKIQVLPLTTTGDRIQDRTLRAVGGKGLFVKEIEEALLSKKADFAVHSLKDVPAKIPDGLKVGVILERENPSDALISLGGLSLEKLPSNAKLGTSSLRRKIQILQKRPDLQILELRGNIDTRLKKLKEGQFDAIVLAYAGLRRLSLESQISETLTFIAAPGQGALGLEYRAEDSRAENLLKTLHHAETALCVKAERLILEEFEGNCELPLGAQAFIKDEQFYLRAFLALPDGSLVLEEEIAGPVLEHQVLTLQLIEKMNRRGAEKIVSQYQK